jgi:hypothetical protein
VVAVQVGIQGREIASLVSAPALVASQRTTGDQADQRMVIATQSAQADRVALDARITPQGLAALRTRLADRSRAPAGRRLSSV